VLVKWTYTKGNAETELCDRLNWKTDGLGPLHICIALASLCLQELDFTIIVDVLTVVPGDYKVTSQEGLPVVSKLWSPIARLNYYFTYMTVFNQFRWV
jgi:hypothetical protein